MNKMRGRTSVLFLLDFCNTPFFVVRSNFLSLFVLLALYLDWYALKNECVHNNEQ